MKRMVLDFLEGLQENNTREWFQEHKAQYHEAKKEVEAFVNLLIPEIARFDKSIRFVAAKDCIFRINRDIRFAKDKSPYKTNFGSWITHAGRKSPGPGYYLHIQPGGCFLSMGVYMPDPDQLKKIRKEIYYNVSEFKAILDDKKIRKFTGGLETVEKMKTAPRDFPRDFPDIDLLKHKHYVMSYPLQDGMIVSDKLFETIVPVFRAVYPFNEFLRRALED